MSKNDVSHAEQQRAREREAAKVATDGGSEVVESQDAKGPEISDVELVQLRIRVIALENLVIALLADAPERQLVQVREMAAFITPRPGQQQHPLTLSAASHMLSLVHRAGHFRGNDEGGCRSPTAGCSPG